ncbi:MAG: HAD-IB family phosphatase [Candidatus Marinimicrobia bacterium]|jgi:D-3-phosphoglycerate dehydrogenase|nr:HAD-IB family phosphatase [Candidatus Neomarinimicrobiota bacterium]MBT3497219.1 HAD-IB family phosphatase [Candidatus Neomarinimicrobiota bacterium]MBT3692478.1 HAD-IB family phosphatase [Candidatus Neomarinimicrobiota bacterium]MBT3732721.1 HAD-IB family phosphatase [Candidatus Neomarinimicrobiota bacterium]MBT4145059.1 HAD-IB family phosphatase [Candidatus Neomarinimicrobiota bacterium]
MTGTKTDFLTHSAFDYKSIIFDFDSTIIKTESLDKLAQSALADHPNQKTILGKIQAITVAGMNGEIPFDESLPQRIKLFSANQALIQKIGTALIKDISDSFHQNRQWIKTNAEWIYVVSGGFREILLPACIDLGFKENHIFGNELFYDTNGQITGINKKNPLSQVHGKALLLASLSLPKPIAVIGDGMTDFEIVEQGQGDVFFAFTENIRRPLVVEKSYLPLHSLNGFIKYFQIS